MGTELIRTQFVDITDDGVPDAFVTYACMVGTSSAAQQLEVFDGSSDPEEPRRIGVLVKQSDGVDERGLRVRKLTFGPRTVGVEASAFDTFNPNCCPSLRVRQQFTWYGTKFVAGERELAPLG